MPKAQEVVRFGDFELDIPAYALRRNGEPVKLERRPMDPPRQVISCVRGTAFSVGDSAIYYLPCQSSPKDADKPTVMALDLVTGKERAVGALEGYENTFRSGFSASPDGRTFAYNRLINRGEDLMLIENFR
jgi:hypothetical protein